MEEAGADSLPSDIQAALRGLNCEHSFTSIFLRLPEERPLISALIHDVIKDIHGTANIERVESSSAATVPSTEATKPITVTPTKQQTPVSSDVSIDLNVEKCISDCLFSIPELPGVVPKGKHEVFLHETLGLAIRSKTNAPGSVGINAIRIAFDNITGVFALEVKDQYGSNVTHWLVLTLNMPITLGKTAHAALAFVDNAASLAKSGPAKVTLQRAVHSSAWKNAGRLEELVGGPVGAEISSGCTFRHLNNFTLIRCVLEALVGKVGESDASLFKSSTGGSYVKCYHKVNDGVIFPLRKCFLFGLRPLICIPHKDIAKVSVGRSGGTMTRTFDLDIETVDKKKIAFSMIENAELDALRNYVATRTFGQKAEPAAEGAGAQVDEVAAGTPAKDDPTTSLLITQAKKPLNMNEAESVDGGSDDGDSGDDSDDDEDSEFEFGGEEDDGGEAEDASSGPSDGSDEDGSDGDDDEGDGEDDDNEDGSGLSGVEQDELAALLEEAGDDAAATVTIGRKRRRNAGVVAPAPASSTGRENEVTSDEDVQIISDSVNKKPRVDST